MQKTKGVGGNHPPLGSPKVKLSSGVGSSDSSQPVVTSRTIVSYNMHGFNQGSPTVRDLSLSIEPDIFCYKSIGSRQLICINWRKTFPSINVYWYFGYAF